MLVAAFNETAGWRGKTITFEDERFVLEDDTSQRNAELDSSRAPSYGITLYPADAEAAGALCLHIHGCSPAAIWIEGDVA